MFLRLRVASPRQQFLPEKSIAAWAAAASQVEAAPTDVVAVVDVEPLAEAHAVKVWKSSAQLS